MKVVLTLDHIRHLDRLGHAWTIPNTFEADPARLAQLRKQWAHHRELSPKEIDVRTVAQAFLESQPPAVTLAPSQIAPPAPAPKFHKTSFALGWAVCAVLVILLAFASLAHCQAVTLMPIPEQQFFDQNGKPLSNGFVYTYIIGTSTPLASYTDYTGSTANTNPVLLNGAGFPTCSSLQCGIWINPSTPYRIVLQNSSHVVQYTIDGVGKQTTALVAERTQNVFNANTSQPQVIENYIFPAGSLNFLGKTFELDMSAQATLCAACGNQTLSWGVQWAYGAGTDILSAVQTAVANNQHISLYMHLVCTTTLTGTTGRVMCGGHFGANNIATNATIISQDFDSAGFGLLSTDLTVAETIQPWISFSTNTTQNTTTAGTFIIKQDN
jgi:hypothetical protein